MSNLPKGWIETKLGQIVEIVNGGTPSTSNENYWNGNISWITPKDLSNFEGRYILKGEKSITQEGLNNSSAKLLPINTVLFSSRAPIGYVAIAQQEVSTNQGFKNIICDEVNTHYLYMYYWLKINAKHIEKLSSGSTFSEASTSLMKSLNIKIPKIDEQKEIASILSSFDKKIELLKEQNQTLETMAQTIFKEWFVDFNYPNATVEMIDSEMGEIPKGWRVGRIGDEFDITIGRTPPRQESQWFSEVPQGMKWASIKDMGNAGVYIFNTSEYIVDEAIVKFNIPIIPENTTILSFKMTVGKVSITTEKMLSNEAIAHMKIKKDSYLTSEYIYLFLLNLNFNTLGSTSSIVTAINTAIIKKIRFLIPDEFSMNNFTNLIIPIFTKIKNNSKQIQTLEETRDSLLPKLMSGQKRVFEYDN